jgi:hypothetical protein
MDCGDQRAVVLRDLFAVATRCGIGRHLTAFDQAPDL